jgi:Replication-relaxation
LRLVAAANHVHIRNLAALTDDRAESETSRVVQRGEAWLLQRIGHTAGIYSFFASLTQAARREPGHELCWWETGIMCERRYLVGEQWYNFRPDALAEYRLGQQHLRFWLEWDRGTMNVRDLAIKFTSYGHYLTSREWARECSQLPVLVCVAPDIAQEQRMQREAQARLAHIRGFELWTVTEVLLKERGTLAPIWLQGIPQCNQASQQEGSHRQCLFDAML